MIRLGRHKMFALVSVIITMALSCELLEDEDILSVNDTEGDITKLVDSLVVMSYNIGHFSNGVSSYSAITSTNYSAKLAEGLSAVLIGNPMVYGIQEFSTIFGTSSKGEEYAKDILFPSCSVNYITNQIHYSCNALFGNRVLIKNLRDNDFECNQNEEITHTTAINARDYRYVSADIYAFGKIIKVVVTHLAFDNNRPSVLQKKQIDELVAKYDTSSYVIMLGDWNVYEYSDFDAFINAGYSLANDGSKVTFPSGGKALDNIVVKGMHIEDCYVEQTSFSDHYPIIAVITD